MDLGRYVKKQCGIVSFEFDRARYAERNDPEFNGFIRPRRIYAQGKLPPM